MTIPVSLNIDIHLDSIFPRCLKEYYDVISKIGDPSINRFNNVCSGMRSYLGLKKHGFYNSCIDLSNYLEHIKDNKPNDKISYCTYFNFKLKDKLNGLQHNCEGEVGCYAKMLSVMDGSTGKNNVSNICKDHINVLDNATFSLFQMLKGLYYKSHELLIKDEEFQRDNKCFNIYEKLCKIC
ncbi:variable surface protein, partial [Plasmodium gonderi]